MKTKKNMFCFSVVVVLMLFAVGFWKAGKCLTYIEFTTYNDGADAYVELAAPGGELTQDFVMPYDILHGFSVRVGTFGKDNNSKWQYEIRERDTGKVLCQNTFNASRLKDNEYTMIPLDTRKRVVAGGVYQLVVRAVEVSGLTKLAFYTSDGNSDSDLAFFHDGEEQDAGLSIRLYGGDRDYWWTGFLLLLFVIAVAALCRIYICLCRGIALREDVALQCFAVGILFFLLCASYCHSGMFMDEIDNMMGGMQIANGKVLYRDYVAQHTPVAYYLCGIFAFLGAGSVAQFRLSFYLLEAAAWAFLYLRHRNFFGKGRMFALPLLEAVFIPSIMSVGCQVLADHIQGFFTVMLLLEFLRYCEDHELGWDRCVIVSVAIWGCFGSAFISAYALFGIGILVVVKEVSICVKEKPRAMALLARYARVMIALIVPFISAVVYFKVNGALRSAYSQFYVFNREVYPLYQAMGDQLMRPFVTALQNFCKFITDDFLAIPAGKATAETVLQLVILCAGASSILLLLFRRRKRFQAIGMLYMLCCSATRGYGFHGLASWFVAVMAIALYGDFIISYLQRVPAYVVALCAVVLLCPYVMTVGNNLLYETPVVSELEGKVIELTEGDEDKSIYMDEHSYNTLYLSYKGRNPVNSAVWMLPWFMDWYEGDDIRALITTMPKVVIYNENEEIWGYTHYSAAFVSELNQRYARLSDDAESGWKYYLWVRK